MLLLHTRALSVHLRTFILCFFDALVLLSKFGPAKYWTDYVWSVWGVLFEKPVQLLSSAREGGNTQNL